MLYKDEFYICRLLTKEAATNQHLRTTRVISMEVQVP